MNFVCPYFIFTLLIFLILDLAIQGCPNERNTIVDEETMQAVQAAAHRPKYQKTGLLDQTKPYRVPSCRCDRLTSQ
jgi:hypothetical protein